MKKERGRPCTPQDLLLAGADDIYINGLAKDEYRTRGGSCCVLGSLGESESDSITDRPINLNAGLILQEYLAPERDEDYHLDFLVLWNDCEVRGKWNVISAMHDAARSAKPETRKRLR